MQKPKNYVFLGEIDDLLQFPAKKKVFEKKKDMILKDLETGYLPMYLSPFRLF